ncbi:MAG: DUF3592 domain-containing protein [Lentisphaeria bacterium]|nr:DUF3592 domain-containing protein [Lentisphaeria bacterium]NQZ68858.1 DUF3592 domain-containing protein [Lentisphaeria bacterium]
MPTMPDPDLKAAISSVKTDIWFSKYFLFVWFPLVLLLGYLCFPAYNGYQGAKATENWPNTIGIVTHMAYIETEEGLNGRKPGGTSRWTEVEYSYQVAGKEFTSRQVSYNNETTSYRNAKLFSKKYPEGSEITVYYNPDDPEEALLYPGLDVGGYIILPLLILMEIILFWGGISLFSYNRFVGIVKAGDLSRIRGLCHNIKYGETPLRALLIAAQLPDDRILKEVIRGATPEEIANVMAYCKDSGLDHAYEQLSVLKVDETPETTAMDRKGRIRSMMFVMSITLPVLVWAFYIMFIKIQ